MVMRKENGGSSGILKYGSTKVEQVMNENNYQLMSVKVNYLWT